MANRRPTHAERRLRPGAPGWPARLDELPDPPAALRVLGRLPPWEGAVAVVGTRYADEEALEFARALGVALAAAGRTVISGGAVGIDAAAHRGALDVGGATVAVLASGFDPPFPAKHAGLFAEITAAGGALVSEHEDGRPAERWTFLARNRLIAALAEAVVVVQAPARSGALSTAAAAGRLKKPVFSVPHAPWEARGAGCLQLLRGGAQICTSPRDVLSKPAHRTGPGPGSASTHDKNDSDLEGLDEDGRAVWAALGRRAGHPDEIAASLGLPIMRVQRALLQLLLLGLAIERSPGRYARQVGRKQP